MSTFENLKSFKELVELCAARYPDGIAFKWLADNEVTEKSYSEFRGDIYALGTYFYYNGLKNTRIAVIGENTYEWIITYFATVIGGSVIVPVDRDLKEDAIVNVLKDSGSKAIIYTDAYKGIIDSVKKRAGVKIINKSEIAGLIAEGQKLLEKGKNKYINLDVDEKAMSAIIYTSGTTGKPKGVMLNQYGIIQDAYKAAHHVKVSGTSLLVLPIHHTFGFTAGVVAPMFFPVPIAINKNLRTFMSDMQLFKPENMFVVPMFVESMHKKIWKTLAEKKAVKIIKTLIKTSNGMRKFGIDKRGKLFSQIKDAFGGNLSVIISGGAPLDPLYVKAFDDIGILLLNGYGITECSPVVAVNPNPANRAGSVGKILPGLEIKTIDEDENGNGEICVRGSCVMMGYYNDKKATADAFDGDWFRTGDIGYVDEDNYLYISGRQKNLIILNNGKNIYPEELEEMILRIPEVIETVVYCENDIITAEIYTEDPAKVQLAMRELNRELPIYKHITGLKFRTTEFEKTTTKKIKRALVGAGK